MAKNYETGTKDHVIYEAIRCAIQDRAALAHAHSTPNSLSNEDRATIAECEATIRDFEKLGRSLLGQNVVFISNF